jgi:hypothetical protein
MTAKRRYQIGQWEEFDLASPAMTVYGREPSKWVTVIP